MTTSRARQIVLAARPKGKPAVTDFRLEETTIPTPAAGQLLLGVQYLSLDPYMRGRMDDRKSYAKPLQLGRGHDGSIGGAGAHLEPFRLCEGRHRSSCCSL
jgi:NADPH-dependent curcumin reductase